MQTNTMNLNALKTAEKKLFLFHQYGLSKESVCFAFTGLLVFLNPFPHLTAFTNILFSIVLVLFIDLFYRKTIKPKWKNPFSIPLVCYVIISIISTLFALDKTESLGDLFSHLLRYIAIFFIIINCFNTKQRFRYLVRIIIVSGLIFSTASLFYFYIIQGNNLTTRFGTGFTDSAICTMGLITVFTFILSLGEINQTQNRIVKSLLMIGLITVLSASLLSQSRGTILSIITAMLVIDLFKKKILSLVIIFCIIIYYCFSTPLQDRLKASNHYDDRISIYLYSMEIIEDYPVAGTGFSIDTFKNKNLIDPHKYKKRIPERYRSYPMLWPHNMFLSIWVRTGILGLTAYCMLIISFIRLSVRLIRFGKDSFIQTNAIYALSSLTMFCTIGFFSPIFIHFADFTFFIIFSMLTILWSLNKESAEEKEQKKTDLRTINTWRA